MVLYFIASYIRLYPKPILKNVRFWGLAALGSWLLSIASVIVCTWIGSMIDKPISFYFVQDSNTFLDVLLGVSSFLFFSNLRIGYNRAINTMAASTFGVLCIHANSDTMRQWLWKDVLDNVNTYASPFLVPYAIGSVVGVFCICTLIDYVRTNTLEKPFLRWVDSMMVNFKK